MRLKSQVYFSNNYLFIEKVNLLQCFFSLARYGLEILGEAKKAKREGEGLGGGRSYSNFDVWLLNTNKLKIYHVIFTTRADKGNLFHLLKDESRKK